MPVGFRFRPTDEELVRHYLKAKIAGRAHPDLLFIPDVDLSACEPWELPAKALIRSEDPEWFFFAPLDRKYPGGHRSNRSTAAGYWKATGKDRLIRSRPAGALIGIKKTLVFHRGRAPRGQRTAWIMHEYRTTEPHLQQGQNGSFVLYRLFNKHEEEEELEVPDAADSPSTSSPPNPRPITPEVKPENLRAETPAQQQDDPLLDVLAQLPDLQPEQTCDGFPIITSPMRPYTDHPFLSDVGGQDLSAYIDNIIAHQDLGGLLLSPSLAETVEHPTANIEPNPASLLIPSNRSSNNKRNGRAKLDSERLLLIQGADGKTGAAPGCSSATKILQIGTGDSDTDHDMGAQTNLASSATAKVPHFYSQYQLQSANIPEPELPNSGALCSAGSWTPQHPFNNMIEPARSDMADSDAFNGLEGWAAEPSMQQLAVSNVTDPHQGTATRRIRLVYSVQRASVTEPVLTSHLEGEDGAGSCDSTGNSSTHNNEGYANAGEATRVQGGGVIPTQVVSSMEITGKLRDCTFDEGTSPHPRDVLPHGGNNLKQRLRQECRETSYRDACEGSVPVTRDPSLRRRREAARVGSVVRLLCLVVMVIFLVFVGLRKLTLYKSVLQ